MESQLQTMLMDIFDLTFIAPVAVGSGSRRVVGRDAMDFDPAIDAWAGNSASTMITIRNQSVLLSYKLPHPQRTRVRSRHGAINEEHFDQRRGKRFKEERVGLTSRRERRSSQDRRF